MATTVLDTRKTGTALPVVPIEAVADARIPVALSAISALDVVMVSIPRH